MRKTRTQPLTNPGSRIMPHNAGIELCDYRNKVTYSVKVEMDDWTLKNLRNCVLSLCRIRATEHEIAAKSLRDSAC